MSAHLLPRSALRYQARRPIRPCPSVETAPRRSARPIRKCDRRRWGWQRRRQRRQATPA
jgi:hypothetical protein